MFVSLPTLQLEASDVRAGLSSPSLTKPGPKKPKPSLAQALHRPLLGLGFYL